MAIVIKVTTPTIARVEAQPVHPVKVTPVDGARVVVVATPGPPGAAGEDGLVLEDLEPPVDLNLLFENGLA